MGKKKSTNSNGAARNGSLEVLKTYKMYVGGAFPRTESGRFYTPLANKKPLGNICLASRKDVRNAVKAARDAQPGWAGRTAYNRGQILYRIAEMLEGRREQFQSELVRQGSTGTEAKKEVQASIDRLIVYAGWCDKYQQIFSSVNPVASSHFNFSVLEPMGVVFVVANETQSLLGLISLVAPVIAGGNSCVVLASESRPLCAVTFGEVLGTSDVPGGVINILTGKLAELASHIARHMSLDGIAFDRKEAKVLTEIKQFAADDVKRVRSYDADWLQPESGSPYLIQDFSEVKTTWHPIEKIGTSGSGY